MTNNERIVIVVVLILVAFVSFLFRVCKTIEVTNEAKVRQAQHQQYLDHAKETKD